MTESYCPNSGCQLATSARCLEGFDPPEGCPFQSNSLQVTDETRAYVSQELVDLPSGEALTGLQASEVAASGPTKLVVIAGPYGSGKTTILTSVFEAFQEAPFANYSFRGSRTLVGFEKRAHLGRKESGRETADTPHTSIREGIVFLHLDLALRVGFAFDHVHLLLSDVSGEMFKRLRDNSDAVTDFASLSRADHLCVVIDGEKIVNKELRHVARNDSRSILRSILQSGQLSTQCVVDVVFTKWDLIVDAGGTSAQAEIDSFIDQTKEVMSSSASGHRTQFHEVAARPPVKARLPFAHGLPTLLRSFVDHDEVTETKPIVYVESKPRREMSRYTEAVLTKSGLRSSYELRRL